MSTQNVIPGWTMAIPVVLMVVAGWSTNLPIPAQWKLIGVRFSVVAACTFPVVGFFASASTPRLGTFLFGYFIFLAAAVYNFRLGAYVLPAVLDSWCRGVAAPNAVCFCQKVDASVAQNSSCMFRH